MNGPTCAKHKKKIPYYGNDMKKLAEDIGDLHYDTLRQFFKHLANKILADSEKDKHGGRRKLSWQLFKAYHYLTDVCKHIDEAWNISKPYMKEDKNE